MLKYFKTYLNLGESGGHSGKRFSFTEVIRFQTIEKLLFVAKFQENIHCTITYFRFQVPFCPYWTNVKQYWEKRNDDNVLFLKYEDFHKDFQTNARKVAQFLDVTLTDEQLHKIEEHCVFKNMKANPATNYKYWDELGMRKKEGTEFMRKGQQNLIWFH